MLFLVSSFILSLSVTLANFISVGWMSATLSSILIHHFGTAAAASVAEPDHQFSLYKEASNVSWGGFILERLMLSVGFDGSHTGSAELRRSDSSTHKSHFPSITQFPPLERLEPKAPCPPSAATNRAFMPDPHFLLHKFFRFCCSSHQPVLHLSDRSMESRLQMKNSCHLLHLSAQKQLKCG